MLEQVIQLSYLIPYSGYQSTKNLNICNLILVKGIFHYVGFISCKHLVN